MSTAAPHQPARPASPFSLDPDALRCPYPYYEALRAEGRVVAVPEVQAVALTAMADVTAVMRRPQCASSRLPTGPAVAAHIGGAMQRMLALDTPPPAIIDATTRPHHPTLFTIDPPDHTRQRRLMARLFSPAVVAGWEPMVAAITDELVAGAVARGEVDLVRDVAVPIPVRAISRILGMGDIDQTQVKRWSDAMTFTIGNPSATDDDVEALFAARQGMNAYFAERMAACRVAPEDNVISAVAHSGHGGPDGDEGWLSESERCGLLVNFVVAGNETTTKLIASALRMLAEDPSLHTTLRDRPDLVGAFVEEVLRLEPPTQAMFRRVTDDIDLGAGEVLHPGGHVLLLYAAANRDPAVFPEPDRIRLDRANGATHLSFGHGIHLCLGAHLARMEARVAVTAIVAATERIELTGDGPIAYEPTYLLHGARRLDARLVVPAA